jgi:hypothetical protein
MNRRVLLALFALVPMLLAGPAMAGGKEMVDESKIGKLAASAGITSEQAQATVGGLLRLAQGRLETSQYDRIAAVVPKQADYMGVAERLGVFEDDIGIENFAALNAGLAKIGVKPDQVTKVASELSGYVTKAAGNEVGGFFANSIK